MSGRTKLPARELVELYDYVKFTRADGRCECEGDCGRSHRFGIHFRCPNAHGRPAVHGKDKMCSLSAVHLDGDKNNTLDTNLMAMCQTCASRYRGKVKMQTKRTAERKAIETQHEPLFDVGELSVATTETGVNEL